MAASPAQQILPTPPRTGHPPAITDELLEEIFLRIGSPADLARASAACSSFRRLISDPSFLRRYRSLHPPLLLGLLCEGFQPVEAPSPNAPVARALARAADFTFGFLPLPRGRWYRWDVRDGRVLLGCKRGGGNGGFVLRDLVVCDPLSRRYRLLPRIPDDLVAPVHIQERRISGFGAFLIPSACGEEETTFRVIIMMQCVKKLVVFIFSSTSAGWSIGTCTSWDSLSLDPDDSILIGPNCYAYCCFYWKVYGKNKLIRLNMNDMEFAVVDLPLDHNLWKSVIVEAGEGRLGMFYQTNHNDTSLYYTIMQNGGHQRTNEWKMEKIIPLPVGYYSSIVAAREGYIILIGHRRDMVPSIYFSLEIKTLKIDRIGRMIDHISHAYPYFSFPPSMLSRRI